LGNRHRPGPEQTCYIRRELSGKIKCLFSLYSILYLLRFPVRPAMYGNSADNSTVLGELIPLGGGDTIQLRKAQLLVGRRESCDIILRFANVSAHHCQISVDGGYFYIRDLGSRNGIKVNNVRVQEKRLDPGDVLAVAKHRY